MFSEVFFNVISLFSPLIFLYFCGVGNFFGLKKISGNVSKVRKIEGVGREIFLS
jgi:hypothetical protein